MDGTGNERDDDIRVRSEVAHLADESSAPDVPPEVTARVVSALRAVPSPLRASGSSAPPVDRSTPQPKHSVADRPPFNRRIATAVGVLAAAATAGLGTLMVLRAPASTPTTAAPERIRSITVSIAPSVPLSDGEIIGLLSRPADLGALGDANRRASCLTGLGYPASAPVLGAQPVDVNGPAILLVLAQEAPGDLAALVVRPECSAAHTALIAETRVRRP